MAFFFAHAVWKPRVFTGIRPGFFFQQFPQFHQIESEFIHMPNKAGRPAVSDIGGLVNEQARINMRASDTLRLCIDVMARKKSMSATEYVRRVLEADVMAAMMRTTGRFIGATNSGLQQFVHDVRRKAGKE